MSFSETLKRLRLEKGLTQGDLAKYSGLKQSSIAMYETGKRNPKIDVLERLADFFNVDIDYLIGKTDKTTKVIVAPPEPQKSIEAQPTPKVTRYTYRIPVVGRVAAGQPILAQEEIIDYEYIDERLHKGGDQYFGLVVKGASMEPTIHDGDTIIVRVQESVESGQIAVVLVDGEDATVKEVKETDTGLTLIGHNVAVYAPHFYSREEVEKLPVRIIGRVIQSISKF